eukprot:282797-Hanusia_phi.AAC.1
MQIGENLFGLRALRSLLAYHLEDDFQLVCTRSTSALRSMHDEAALTSAASLVQPAGCCSPGLF